MRAVLQALLLLLALPAFAMAQAPAAAPMMAAASTLPEHAIGKAGAPVTIIEYASLTCPHCAHFAKEILPKVEEKYINTGKVRLIYRDFPLDGLSMHAAQLAQCMPDDRYFPFIKTLFSSQDSWLKSTDPEATLQQYAKLGGLSDEKVKSCLADKNVAQALAAQRLEADKKFQVHATPTFVVDNGKGSIAGATTFEEFEKELAKYVK